MAERSLEQLQQDLSLFHDEFNALHTQMREDGPNRYENPVVRDSVETADEIADSLRSAIAFAEDSWKSLREVPDEPERANRQLHECQKLWVGLHNQFMEKLLAPDAVRDIARVAEEAKLADWRQVVMKGIERCRQAAAQVNSRLADVASELTFRTRAGPPREPPAEAGKLVLMARPMAQSEGGEEMSSHNKKKSLRAVDRLGHPLPGVKFQYFDQGNKHLGEIVTDATGVAPLETQMHIVRCQEQHHDEQGERRYRIQNPAHTELKWSDIAEVLDILFEPVWRIQVTDSNGAGLTAIAAAISEQFTLLEVLGSDGAGWLEVPAAAAAVAFSHATMLEGRYYVLENQTDLVRKRPNDAAPEVVTYRALPERMPLSPERLVKLRAASFEEEMREVAAKLDGFRVRVEKLMKIIPAARGQLKPLYEQARSDGEWCSGSVDIAEEKREWALRRARSIARALEALAPSLESFATPPRARAAAASEAGSRRSGK